MGAEGEGAGLGLVRGLGRVGEGLGFWGVSETGAGRGVRVWKAIRG